LFVVELLVAALVAASAWGLGRILLRVTGLRPGSLSGRFAFSMGLGFGVLVYLQMALGFAGAFDRNVAWGVLAGMAFLALLGIYYRRPSLPGLHIRALSNKRQWPYIGVAVAIGVYAIGYLIVALAPTLEGDSLAGYLVTARDYAREGAIVPVEYAYNSVFPANGQMLSSFGYLLRGQIVAQLLVSWVMGVLAASVVYAIGRTWLNRRAAIVGVMIWYATTSVAFLAASGKIDLAWAAFDLLSIAAFGHWYFSNNGDRDWRWLALAGVFLGLAGGVKQASIFTAGVMAIGIAYRLISDRDTDVRHWALAYGPMALLAVPAVIWVARALALTDSPGFTGTNLNNDSGAGGFFKAIWDMSMLGNAGDTEGPNGKSIGPAMLAVIPLAVVVKGLDRRVLHFLVFAALMIIVWFFAVQRARHMLPVLGLLALTSGYLVALMIERRPLVGRALMLGLLAAVAINFATWGWVNFVSLDHAARAFNVSTDDQHFQRNMPELPWYPNATVTAFVRDKTPAEAILAAPSGSNGLYLNRTLYQDRFQTEADFPNPQVFVTRLKADGVTHVYINDFVIGQRGHEQAWLARPDFQTQYLDELVCDAGQCVYELK
jgi:hypothetical protein